MGFHVSSLELNVKVVIVLCKRTGAGNARAVEEGDKLTWCANVEKLDQPGRTFAVVVGLKYETLV
jgi:hypothetical protein